MSTALSIGRYTNTNVTNVKYNSQNTFDIMQLTVQNFVMICRCVIRAIFISD